MDTDKKEGEMNNTERRARHEVRQAIEESIREDRIVHLEATPEITASLVTECEDYACLGGGETEYWGTDDGAAWRVHVA